MPIDLEKLRAEWSTEIAEAQRQGAAEAAVRIELLTNAVALAVELEECERTSDFERARPVMAALEEANRALDVMNLAGIASVLQGLGVAARCAENNKGKN